MASVLTLVLFFVVQFNSIFSVPLARSPESSFRQVGLSANLFMAQRNNSLGLTERVCVVDNVAYSEDDAIPTTSACQQCVCKPPGFACNTVKCPPADADGQRQCHRRVVARETGRSKCCPDYSCDCEKDGRIFHSGQKITDPDQPCQVCYCQQGRIVCSVIRCLSRNDCLPSPPSKGRCCPSYDHCQPLAEEAIHPIRPFGSFAERLAVEVEGRHSQLSGQELDDTVTTDAATPELTTLDDGWTAGDEMAALSGNGREAVQLMDQMTTLVNDVFQPEDNTEAIGPQSVTDQPLDENTWTTVDAQSTEISDLPIE